MRHFTIIEAEQRSLEWFSARVGRLTGSAASDMLATKKAKKGEPPEEAVVHRDLRMRLAVEQLTGIPAEDGYSSRDMQRGIALEPEARRAYEAATGVLLRQTGFLSHITLKAGCSLDGHVGDFAGIVEIKCPKMFTHFLYWQTPSQIPSEYRPQCVHNLWISGAPWCDFISYDPRFPKKLQLLVIRLFRTEQEMSAYELCARLFLREVEQTLRDVVRVMEAA